MSCHDKAHQNSEAEAIKGCLEFILGLVTPRWGGHSRRREGKRWQATFYGYRIECYVLAFWQCGDRCSVVFSGATGFENGQRALWRRAYTGIELS